METVFFLSMMPPTVTYQEKRWRMVKGKMIAYEPPRLKEARAKLIAHLYRYRPEKTYTGPLQLTAKWCFPCCGKHHDGEYRTSKPDTDNLQKLLKDCMTTAGYWSDDAFVVSEIAEKFWADQPGIFIRIRELQKPEGVEKYD